MVKEQDLFKFGIEYSRIDYESFSDWFIQFGDVRFHWKYQPTYLISQFAFILGGVATFIHAFRNGGRLPYLWLATLLHGIVVECMSYAVPDIDNFWHSQTPIIFLGRRLPLHIIFLYPCFLYQASIAVEKLRIRSWARPFAVGLLVVLIDIPYDIVSVNFLHWTWHDTDPNIAERHYWVPWNSYYFHACFAASFTFFYHKSAAMFRSKNLPASSWNAGSCLTEMASAVVAGVLGTPGGILMFIPIYHPLHDLFKVPTEVTFFMLFSCFLLIIWSADRMPKLPLTPQNHKILGRSTVFLVTHLVLHYVSFLAILLFFRPENEFAIGLKEPIGKCNDYVDVQTIFGMTLQKRNGLCASDYDEKYFDWTCLTKQKPPQVGSVWYTACGVKLPNFVEYLSIIATLTTVAAIIFYTAHKTACHCGDKAGLIKNRKKRV